jgi:hypothetical protein
VEPSPLPAEPAPLEDPLPIPYLLPFPGTVPVPVPFRTGPVPSYQEPASFDLSTQEDTEPSIESPEAGPSETFIISNFYGGAPHQFATGKGEFAGPKFRLGTTLTFGYDDNIYQTSEGIDGLGGGDKASSFFTSLAVTANIRKAAHRRLLLLDAITSADHYWNEDSTNYNFDLSLIYLYRFLAPSQITTNLRVAYLNQPDYSQVNFIQQENREKEAGNSYFTASGKVDLSYRWSPRFSTVTSLSGNSILYEGSLDEGSFVNFTAGNEFRFRTERFTWIAEGRYEILHYLNVEDQDSDTLFLLLGAEWKFGKWVLASARFGEAIRFFDLGGSSSSPFGEFAIVFRPDVQNAISLSARYGYEAGNVGDGESTVFRMGLSYTRALTSRFSATLAGNYVQTEASGGDSANNQTILDGTFSLNFRASDRLSFGASISATRSESDSGLQDFDRHRVALSANYQF